MRGALGFNMPDTDVAEHQIAQSESRRATKGDGLTSFELLRWRCPCAECAGEAGLPGKLASTTELTDDQVELNQMEAVGLFGIRPYWKDGHDTGIYGLSFLRAICPCEECAAR